MDYLTPGPRELLRKLRRLIAQRQLATLDRALAKAETDLGLLGWQQAEYDPDTQRQVTELQGVEKEQARLVNDAAAAGLEIRKIQNERQAGQREFDERLRPLEAEWRKLREPCDALERQLAEKRKIEPKFGQRMPELDRELRETQKSYTELIQRVPQTPQIRQELARLRERIVAIPNEKSDIRTQHLRTVSEIRAMEEELEMATPPVKSLEEQIWIVTEEWKALAAVLDEAIKEKEAARRVIESKSDELESAKSNPYQRIGAVLADNNIAPLNQPEALDIVKRLRFEAGERKQVILESEARSAAEGQTVVTLSLVLWLVIAVLFVAVVLALRIW